MATKKPKHDPATAWKKPDPVNTTGFAGGPTMAQLQQAYGRIMAGVPGVNTSYSQPTTGFYQYGSYAPRVLTGYTVPGPNKIRWADVQVGQTVDGSSVDWGSVSAITTRIYDSEHTILYVMSDESEGRYDPSLRTVTKTRAGAPPAPVATPEDIEETTEVLTGWRVFSVRDYKLRGTWSTWEGRVFHASCNCEEFRDRNNYNAAPVTEFQLREERRGDLRKHLAAGIGTCGVYSRKRLTLDKHYIMEIYAGSAVSVVARCVNYGLGYEYDAGYRSEYSRIEHLWLLAKGPVYDPTNGGGQYPLCHAGESQGDSISPDTLAQVLATTYGVPCDVMTPLEFAYKEEASLL